MSEARMVLPLLSKIGPSTECTEAEESNITAKLRSVNVNNKRIATGFVSGPALTTRKPAEPQVGTNGNSATLIGVDFPNASCTPSPEVAITGIQDKNVCLPAIEAPEESRQQRIRPPLVQEPVLPTPSDAAYIRSRSVTPSLLGAPRDLLPRSKKTTLFAGYLPDLPQHDDDGNADRTELSLTIEGHRDLKLPPRRTPTEPRKVEKSRLKLALMPVSHLLDDADDFSSWEENLKKLLLCQSMGLKIEVSNKQHDFVRGKSVRPIFHCPRCLKHWSEHGVTPDDCQEPEVPTAGPIFNITNRSHEIMRDFESLALEDKQRIADVIISRGSVRIAAEERDGLDSLMDVTLTGRRANVGDKDSKSIVDIRKTKSSLRRATIDDKEETSRSQEKGKVNGARQHDFEEEKTPPTGFNGEETETDLSRALSRQPLGDHRPGSVDNSDQHLGLARDNWGTEGLGHAFGSSVGRHTGDVTDDKRSLNRFHEVYGISKHKRVGKFEFHDTQSQPEETGQYGPDGAFYPGYYGPDGCFIATCRIAPDGQCQPVVKGPDGKFYANATYGPDGRFNLWEAGADKHGVVFLSAAEMAALTARQFTKQGAVGPDGFFYPNGFYQPDGSFVPGGPPHSGHPVVWGPTAENEPPSDFGPAWPPGTPGPYSQNQEAFGPGKMTKDVYYPDEEGKSAGFASLPTMADPNRYAYADHPHSTLSDSHLDHLGLEASDGKKQEQSEESENQFVDKGIDDNQPRDLFSPWETEHARSGYTSIAAEKSTNKPLSTDTEKQSVEEYEMNLEIVLNDDVEGKENENRQDDYQTPELQANETYALDDLEKDVSLQNLDSRIIYVGSDEDASIADGMLHRESLEDAVLPIESDSPCETEYQGAQRSDDIDKSKQVSTTNMAEADDAVTTLDTDEMRPRKRRESTATYMGIVDQTDSNYRHDSSDSQDRIAKARRGSVYADGRSGSARRGSSKNLPSKTAKNLAVRNVTGKPETKAGMLLKHMFATPHANLTQTNSIGINNRLSTLDVNGSKNTIKGSETTALQSQDDVLMAKPKLPSIGGGEPSKDVTLSKRSQSAIKQQSMSRIGSGEERRHSDTDSLMMPPDDTVKPRSGKRGAKVVKKTGKETRKSVARRQQLKQGDNEGKEEQQIDANEAKSLQDAIVGTYNDLINAGETVSRDKIALSPTKSSSLLGKFSEFRVSVPASSPLPTEHAPSFRMAYSTLPSFGANEAQSTVPTNVDDERVKSEAKTSLSKVIPFDFEKGYEIRARKSSSTRTLKSKKSGTKTSKSRMKRSGSMSSDSGRASQSSSAESVWESVSEIWKRHKNEMATMQRYLAESYLPLTHAFTFSMFSLPPGYAAHNRLLLKRANAIKQLRKPLTLNKPRAAANRRKSIPAKPIAPVK